MKYKKYTDYVSEQNGTFWYGDFTIYDKFTICW